ncbi:MAG: hypothetical protein V3R64_04580 [Sphingomonadales bacterium]
MIKILNQQAIDQSLTKNEKLLITSGLWCLGVLFALNELGIFVVLSV